MKVLENLKKAEWRKMLLDFKGLVNSGTNCIDSSDFSCAETCVQLDSVFQYSSFVENLFRNRLGACNRYWIWDDKISAFEAMLNMTPADRVIMEQCSGECNLELLDDLLLTRFEDVLATTDLSTDAQMSVRMSVTKQISLMQGFVKTESCAENFDKFDCSMGCINTVGGALDTLDNVSKQVLGKCRFHHKQFTNVHNELRTQLNVVEEPVETTMLFDDQLTCSYSDLGDVVQAYRDYVTENYKYNSGSRLITSYESAYLVFMEFANKAECRDSTIIDCDLIEPGNFDFSNKQATSNGFGQILQNAKDTLNIGRQCKQSGRPGTIQSKITIFVDKSNKILE